MDIWTGPALSNPRNRSGTERQTNIGAQFPDIREALHGHTMHRLSRGIVIRAGNHRAIAHGRVDEVTVSGAMVSFHLWEPSDGGSRKWRVCHLVTAHLGTGAMTVKAVHVAPDRPEDDAEHAPSPA